MTDQGINIVVLGKTGVGKSSFCNYIFGENLFLTGGGKPVTGWDDNFSHYSIEYSTFTLNVYDSVGIEINNLDKWNKKLDQFIYEKNISRNSTPMEWIHGIFYLINAASARIEDQEISIIKDLFKKDIPVSIILTNSDAAGEDKILGIERAIRKDIVEDIDIHQVCSVSIKKRVGSSKQYGKEEVLDHFIHGLDEKLRKGLVLYFLDKMEQSLYESKRLLVLKIEDSDLGFFNLIKSAINDGDFDDLIDLDEDFLDEMMEEYTSDLDQLNDFLFELGFNKDKSTADYLNEIVEKLDSLLEVSGSSIEEKLGSVSEYLDSGSVWDNIKGGVKVLGALTRIKSFLINLIEELLLPAESYVLMKKMEVKSKNWES